MAIGQTKTKSHLRIGPHNLDVISFLFGAILSDAQAERHGNGTRVVLQQESTNREFLTWYTSFLAMRGYTYPAITILSRVGANNTKRFYSRGSTWTYTSFNWLHECFYVKGVKVVPSNDILFTYLTPMALAIWIMGDGYATASGCRLCTNCFSKADCERICHVLGVQFGLNTSVNSAGAPNQWVVYIGADSLPTLQSMVKEHMVPSMYYKVHL
uniref:LAGLIDADG endonuclease n=1 Tax=Chytriomyces confervae TaxID=246404 RepID=A0A4P8NPT7_9FUNG|nr:LAGLIDADG endonuclease [Chytriomyces confervae]QCQ69067.1 LAGLIDADG endonuclease [Chytriomyces confervae]